MRFYSFEEKTPEENQYIIIKLKPEFGGNLLYRFCVVTYSRYCEDFIFYETVNGEIGDDNADWYEGMIDGWMPVEALDEVVECESLYNRI